MLFCFWLFSFCFALFCFSFCLLAPLLGARMQLLGA